MPFVQLLTHSYQIMRQYAGERRPTHKNWIETKMHLHNSNNRRRHRRRRRNIGHKNRRGWKEKNCPRQPFIQRATSKWNNSMGFPKPQMALCMAVAARVQHNNKKLFQLTGFCLRMLTVAPDPLHTLDAKMQSEKTAKEKNPVNTNCRIKANRAHNVYR